MEIDSMWYRKKEDSDIVTSPRIVAFLTHHHHPARLDLLHANLLMVIGIMQTRLIEIGTEAEAAMSILV
jgi:hypothetical protein